MPTENFNLFKCIKCGWVQRLSCPDMHLLKFCPGCKKNEQYIRLYAYSEMFEEPKQVLLHQPYFSAIHNFTKELQREAKKIVLEEV